MAEPALRVEGDLTEFEEAFARLLEAVSQEEIILTAPGQDGKVAGWVARGDELPFDPIAEVIAATIDEVLPQVAEGKIEAELLPHKIGEGMVEAARAIIEQGLVEGPERSEEWNWEKMTGRPMPPPGQKRLRNWRGQFKAKSYRKPQPTKLLATGELVDNLDYELVVK